MYDGQFEPQWVSLYMLTLKAFFIHEHSQPTSEALRTSGPRDILQSKIAQLQHVAACEDIISCLF